MSLNNISSILFLHDKPSGGAGESLLQLVNSLKSEYNCSIIFTQNGFLKSKFEAIKSEVPQIYYPSTGSWLLNRNFGWSVLNYLRLFLALIGKRKLIAQIMRTAKEQKAAMIYSNTIYLIEGAIAAKLLGIPHIWQIRELFDLDYYQYCIPKSHLVKILSWLSKAVVCNSTRTKKALQNLGGPVAKVSVIHNIVNAPKENLDIKEKLGLSSTDKTICILGWITPNKRIEDFIAVANNFSDEKNMKFLIIGGFGGKEKYNQKIRQLLENSPNRKNIIHTGIIPNAVNYLSSIDLLLCPCYTESFGRTVGEALATGTPAIGVRESATQELIQEGHSGYLVDKEDVNTLTKYVRTLIENDQSRHKFGANGKHDMEQNFSTKHILPLYQQLFKDALNS